MTGPQRLTASAAFCAGVATGTNLMVAIDGGSLWYLAVAAGTAFLSWDSLRRLAS